MKLRILDAEKRRAIDLQADIVRQGEFFLAGGTGLGLRLGHRLSKDLDWFTPKRFSPRQLKVELGRLAGKPTAVRQDGPHTVRAFYEELETSFIYYAQVPAKPELVTISGKQIPLADLGIMAAMKAGAVHDRGAKRDFVDIHTICSQPGWSVGRFIEHASALLPLSPEQVRLALTYFADAEKEPMPEGFTVPWERVKTDLAKGIREWERKRDQDLDR